MTVIEDLKPEIPISRISRAMDIPGSSKMTSITYPTFSMDIIQNHSDNCLNLLIAQHIIIYSA
ncbi:MAG: hypothetical protein QXU18_16020 [Thermoplasmatales archaeon]